MLLSSSSASSSLGLLSLMSTSSVPSGVLEISQVKYELANNSTEADSQAAETQFITCCLEGCLSFPRGVQALVPGYSTVLRLSGEDI